MLPPLEYPADQFADVRVDERFAAADAHNRRARLVELEERELFSFVEQTLPEDDRVALERPRRAADIGTPSVIS